MTWRAAADRVELMELLARYTDEPDLPDWDELPQRVLADEVHWDFSSMGIPAGTLPRDQLVAQLRTAFTGWEATLHVTTSHQVAIDGDRATIHAAKVRAEHWLPADVAAGGPDRWLVVGFYDHVAVRTADGWRLSEVKLTVRRNEHPELLRLAMRRPTR